MHKPRDARSACVGGIDVAEGVDAKAEVLSRRAFGAPVVFTFTADRAQVWRPGPDDAQPVGPPLSREQLLGFLEKNRRQLAPRAIYHAKTFGRLARGGAPKSDFVDTALLPFAEQRVGGNLVQKVEEVIDLLRRSFGKDELSDREQEWAMKSAFRLLGGKVLRDKEVPGFNGQATRGPLTVDVVRRELVKVNRHYGSDEKISIGSGERRRALLEAAERIRNLWDLRHLTTEALADVYEGAMLDKDARKRGGTHRTPSHVADYVVWQLAPWIEQLDPDRLRAFEAACGHSPFLVSTMRLLRNTELGRRPEDLGPYFRQRLAGIDFDGFAIEVAKLSLTVADVPNSNGWHQVRRVRDMFRGDVLADEIRKCSLMFSNPPFEGDRPVRLLRATLDNLQPGAVFGLILPTSQLFTRDPKKAGVRELRDRLLETCQLQEVTLLPDGVFEKADQECTLLLGRRVRGERPSLAHVRCRRVREEDRAEFEKRYAFSTDRVFPQARFRRRPDRLPWVEEFEDVWDCLAKLPHLASIAGVGNGFDRYSVERVPEDELERSERPRHGAVAYYKTVPAGLQLHQTPKLSYIHQDFRTVKERRWGTELGKPQVLLNYHPVDRGLWRLKPFIDPVGRPFTSRFVCVRPKCEAQPLQYLWALCCSPIANAYVYTHTLKRDILVGMFRNLPVPKARPAAVTRVADAAAAYLDACRRHEEGGLFEGGTEVTIGQLHHLLRQMDAEVLRLYGLPARSEAHLLRQFTDPRPGVPGEFKGYYPGAFKGMISLHVYLSKTYQRFRREGAVELPPEVEREFNELADRDAAGALSPADRQRLVDLQAEVAGRDYAIAMPDEAHVDGLRARQQHTRRSLAERANRLADWMHRRGRGGG